MFPMPPHREAVPAAWTDYNGHMNVAYYVLAFDHATDSFLDAAGLDAGWREREQRSVFVVETHVTYHQEVLEGALLRIQPRALTVGNASLRLFHTMHHDGDGFLAATNEVMLVQVDLVSRRSVPWEEEVRQRLQALADADGGPWPEQAGRGIGQR